MHCLYGSTYIQAQVCMPALTHTVACMCRQPGAGPFPPCGVNFVRPDGTWCHYSLAPRAAACAAHRRALRRPLARGGGGAKAATATGWLGTAVSTRWGGARKCNPTMHLHFMRIPQDLDLPCSMAAQRTAAMRMGRSQLGWRTRADRGSSWKKPLCERCFWRRWPLGSLCPLVASWALSSCCPPWGACLNRRGQLGWVLHGRTVIL